MENQIERKVIVMESGEQIVSEVGAGMSATVHITGDRVKKEITLDVTDDEFAVIQEQAMTNDIPADILRSKKAE